MKAGLKEQALKFSERFIDTPSVKLCMREYGDPAGEPVVLIMGLACQLTHWPEHFLAHLIARNLRIICFDNRDAGLSEHVGSNIKVDTRLAFFAHKLGLHPNANYTLHDMAADTSYLISALGLPRAHIVGISMGGMIGQILAAHYRGQVASLTTLMSSTNSPRLPMPELSLLLRLGLAGRAPKSKEELVQRWIKFWRLIQSPDYRTPKQEIENMVRAGFDRNYAPAGTLRQLQAIIASGSLEKIIRTIEVPTQVIHGTKDPLLKPLCGRAIAKHIPGAHLHLIPGMGHDLPKQLSDKLAHLIHQHIETALLNEHDTLSMAGPQAISQRNKGLT